jgi:anti-anti-sigma factor
VATLVSESTDKTEEYLPESSAAEHESDFSIQFYEDVGKVTVKIAGEVDTNSSLLIGNCTNTCINHYPRKDLYFDLSEVSFIDSAGFSSLVRARDFLVRFGQRLSIEQVSFPVARLVELLSVDDASESLDAKFQMIRGDESSYLAQRI